MKNKTKQINKQKTITLCSNTLAILFHFAVPPKWTANPPPNDITIVIEKNGTLECQVTGYPAAITTWYKNGEVLQPSG